MTPALLRRRWQRRQARDARDSTYEYGPRGARAAACSPAAPGGPGGRPSRPGGVAGQGRGIGFKPLAMASIVSFESESSSVFTTQYVAFPRRNTTMWSFGPE